MAVTGIIAEFNPFHNGHQISAGAGFWSENYRYERQFCSARGAGYRGQVDSGTDGFGSWSGFGP